MDGLSGGAFAPSGKSRAVTSYSASAIIGRMSDGVCVDPEFDEDSYVLSPIGDTMSALAPSRAEFEA